MAFKMRPGWQKGRSHEKLWGESISAMGTAHAKTFKEALAWHVYGTERRPVWQGILFGSPLPLSSIGGWNKIIAFSASLIARAGH